MRSFIGYLILALGVILGLYVGVWVCFVGGIIDAIQQIRAPQMDTLVLGFGIVRILFAAVAGWATFFVCLLISRAVTKD